MVMSAGDRVTDPDTPGVWRVVAVGTPRTEQLLPGSVLLAAADADAEMYLLLMEPDVRWWKLIRWVEDLTAVPSPQGALW